ncbi:MAG: guanylate kinase [Chlorobi bacterium]|nr:guanylate kinase [Chlorobiota bacterium]
MNNSRGKLIVFSAPSGSGKTTIVKRLLEDPSLGLAFSVSATSRPKRPGEIHGKDYYFLTPDEFRRKIEEDAFIEWEEVYPGKFYGTLKSEVERLLREGKHIVFDMDVVGGLNLKRYFPQYTMTVFVQAPEFAVLEQRLRARATEDEDTIRERIAKAKREWQFAPRFDRILINDDLDKAVARAKALVKAFIYEKPIR